MRSVQGNSVVLDNIRELYPDFIDRIVLDASGTVNTEFVEYLLSRGCTVEINGIVYAPDCFGPYCKVDFCLSARDECDDDEDDFL